MRGWPALGAARGEPGLPLGGHKEGRQHSVDNGGHVVWADVVQLGQEGVLELLRGFVHDHTRVNGLNSRETGEGEPEKEGEEVQT